MKNRIVNGIRWASAKLSRIADRVEGDDARQIEPEIIPPTPVEEPMLTVKLVVRGAWNMRGYIAMILVLNLIRWLLGPVITLFVLTGIVLLLLKAGVKRHVRKKPVQPHPPEVHEARNLGAAKRDFHKELPLGDRLDRFERLVTQVWDWCRKQQRKLYIWSKTEKGRVTLRIIAPGLLVITMAVFGVKFHLARELYTVALSILLVTTAYDRFYHGSGGVSMVTGGLGGS